MGYWLNVTQDTYCTVAVYSLLRDCKWKKKEVWDVFSECQLIWFGLGEIHNFRLGMGL